MALPGARGVRSFTGLARSYAGAGRKVYGMGRSEGLGRIGSAMLTGRAAMPTRAVARSSGATGVIGRSSGSTGALVKSTSAPTPTTLSSAARSVYSMGREAGRGRVRSGVLVARSAPSALPRMSSGAKRNLLIGGGIAGGIAVGRNSSSGRNGVTPGSTGGSTGIYGM